MSRICFPVTLLLLATLAGAADVSLLASTTTPAVGDSFTITVRVDQAPPFANWQTFLAFDPTKLRVTGQATGSFTTFIPDSRSLADINTSGEVHAGGFGFADNAGGTGTLGVFTFTALAGGTTSVSTVTKSAAEPFGTMLRNTAGVEVLPTVLGPIAITISGATTNNAPVIESGAASKALTTTEDTVGTVSLAGADVDSDPLTWSIQSQGSKGTATVSPSGTSVTVTYTPNAQANGSDSVVVLVADGQGGSDTITVAVTITAVNDAPVATAQTVTTPEDTAKAITLAGTDAEGAALTFAVETSPAQGILSGVAPNLTYTPTANFNGSDSFTFQVNDGALSSAPATVTITVSAVEDLPTISAIADTATAISTVRTDSFTIADAETAAAALLLTATSSNALLLPPGNIVFAGSAGSRTVTVTPAAGQAGTTSVTITVTDESGSTASEAYLLTVTAGGMASKVGGEGGPCGLGSGLSGIGLLLGMMMLQPLRPAHRRTGR